MTRYPTPADRDAMTAYLGGYIEQGNLRAITLAKAVEVLRAAAPGVTVDGMIASRLLRRLRFNRSQLPADAGVITYRSND